MTRPARLALAVCLSMATAACAPGAQRMVPGDGQQFLPGAPGTPEPKWNAAELETDAERTSALEDDFQRRLEESHATGGFLVVLKDGETLSQRAFGSVEPNGAPVTDRTLFMLASVSKLFLALGALSLAEQGHWELDAPIDGFVSGASEAITPRLALSHRAGVPDSSSCEDGLDTPTDWAIAHAADELWSPPGVLFNYSNGGFALAGAALEELTGQRLPVVIEEAVFLPAGATSATYAPSGGDEQRAAGQNPTQPMPEEVHCGLIEAAGGTWASATDMAALLRALLGETDAFSEGLRDELLTAQTSTHAGGRVDYGHGIFLERYGEELVAYHLGGLPWFGAGLLFVPSRRFGLAFAVNAGNFMPFLHDALALYFGPELERTPRSPDLDRLDEYAGLWRDPAGLLGDLRIEAGTQDITLIPLGQQAIWPLPLDGTFWPDAAGEVRYFATRVGVAVKQDETAGE